MAMIWGMFVIALVLAILSARNIWRRSIGRPVVTWTGVIVPWQLDVAFLWLGVIGTASVAPGLFFGQPHWLIDHVWWLLAQITGNTV
jgi:hypothetical protein